MLEYRRYRDAAAHLADLFADGRRYLYRSAPLPPELRRASLDAAARCTSRSARRGDRRPAADAARARHQPHPAHGLARAAAAACCASCSPAPRRFDFDERLRRRGPAHPGGDPVRAARDAQAGEATWTQKRALRADQGGGGRMTELLERTVEALLFLSPEPVSTAELAEACDATEARGRPGARRCSEAALAEGSAASSCARSRAATRSPPTRSPRTPRGGCCRSRARRRSPRPRPRRWRSSPTCSRSRARRSPASAASPPSRRCRRSPSGA